MDIDLKKLKEAAEMATPGPWVDNRNLGWAFPQTQVEAPDIGRKVAVLRNGELDVSCTIGKAEIEWANAAYIAAANPAAVLELIARLERAEAAMQSYHDSMVYETNRADRAEGRLKAIETGEAAPNDPLDDVLPLPAPARSTVGTRLVAAEGASVGSPVTWAEMEAHAEEAVDFALSITRPVEHMAVTTHIVDAPYPLDNASRQWKESGNSEGDAS